MKQKDFEDYLNNSEDLGNAIYTNLQRIIELLQSFKQIAVDQSSHNIYEFSLYEKINHVITSLRSRLKRTKIKVEVDCNKALMIKTNPGILSQIFTNFISNSLMHGFDLDDEGRIDIKAFKVDDKLHIIYKDNGKGIAEDILPKIFDKFFTTKRTSGESGLGMHIIQNIIQKKLNGTITAKSKLNEGIEFEIIF